MSICTDLAALKIRIDDMVTEMTSIKAELASIISANCTSTYDSDAVAYLTATGIPDDSTMFYGGTWQQLTGHEIWVNVNALFVAAKNGNVYSDFHALYLNIGNTISQQKYNAFNPQDTDAAYRLSYSNNGEVLDQNGIHFNGVGYVSTHFLPSSNGGINDLCIGYTQRNNKSGRSFGTYIGYNSITLLDYANRNAYNNWITQADFVTDKSQLQIAMDRGNAANFDIYIDAVPTNYPIATNNGAGANEITFGGYDDSGNITHRCEANFTTMFITKSLTPAKHTLIKNILYSFNNDMKRTQRNAYFFGDSITDGANASPTITKRWTKLLSDSLSLNEINRGKAGTVLISSTPAPYPPCMVDNLVFVPNKTPDDKYVFIAYGVNDAMYLNQLGYTNYTPTLFGTQLQDIIDDILSKGWNAQDIVLVTGYITTNSNTATYANFVAVTHTVGNANGCQVIDLSTSGYALSDPTHPTTAGHATIATYIKANLI